MGEAGRLLRVNLVTRQFSVSNLPAPRWCDLLGGKGLQAGILWDETREVGPWSGENKLVLVAGPLTGLPVPGACILTWTAKSPATGSYGESLMGGYLGAELRNAGYEAVIIEGTAASPSILIIDDDHVQLSSASSWWGEGCIFTESSLLAELGPDFQVACIGPAGENRVRFATISHRYGQYWTRTGLGAVMGDKKLKAIAVRGTRGIRPRYPRVLLDKTSEILKAILEKSPLANPGPGAEYPVAPAYNFRSIHHNHPLTLTPAGEEAGIPKACFACPCPCTRQVSLNLSDGSTTIEAPGYQATVMLGANCGLASPEEVAAAFHTCSHLGLDPVSAGNLVSFAMECAEKGLIGRKLLGKKIHYGRLESLLYLLGKITWRDGLGELLADGVERTSRFLGCPELAVQVKGLEWGGWYGGNIRAALLANMTADLGAGAEGPWPGGANPVESVILKQDRDSLLVSLGLCPRLWSGLGLEALPGLLAAATGAELDEAHLRRVAERAWNITRAYWIREVPGFNRDYDLPPPRLASLYKHHQELLDQYYRERGWDTRGWPTAGKLEELGLGYIREELPGTGL